MAAVAEERQERGCGCSRVNVLNRSALRRKEQLPFFEIPALSALGWVKHAFLTRRGGGSLPPYESLNLGRENGDEEEHVRQNRRRVGQSFDFDPEDLILLNQRHRDRILLLRQRLHPFPPLLEYDAVITDLSNQFVGILAADCLPVFLVDPEKKIIAAVHAGRQGTALGITAKVVRKMKEEWGCSPPHLLVAMGPAIGLCCYEIDEAVFLPEWESFATPKGDKKWMLDLAEINLAQLDGEGVKKEQIFRIDLCTCCQGDLFFSYRRDGRTGRQLSFIGMV